MSKCALFFGQNILYLEGYLFGSVGGRSNPQVENSSQRPTQFGRTEVLANTTDLGISYNW